MNNKFEKMRLTELKEKNESKLMKVISHKKGQRDDLREKIHQQKEIERKVTKNVAKTKEELLKHAEITAEKRRLKMQDIQENRQRMKMMTQM